jgi:Fe-Mn family superoxide dismutase
MILTQSLPTWQLDAFEPAISTETMFVHVHKLHKGYVDKLNAKFAETGLLGVAPSRMLANPEGFVGAANEEFYRDMMGGNVTHTLFWKVISPTPLRDTRSLQLFRDFNLDEHAVKEAISREGLRRFGSGWVWGVIDPRGLFQMYSTRNHDTPYMRRSMPLFCVDVWEHAYFLDRHGDRAAWLKAICEFIDFQQIDEIYRAFLDGRNLIDEWCLPTSRANGRRR